MADAMLESEPTASDAAESRRTIYEFLATCFLNGPTPQQVDAVRSGDLRDLCADLNSTGTPQTLRAESAAELNKEFLDLFKVPGAKYLAPYESVYRDSREIEGQVLRGLLMGESAVDVQKWYRLAALDLEASCKELPDHIGLELAYVAHLCRKERSFAETGDSPRLYRAREMQRDFLAAHVDAWLGALRDKLFDKSRSDHYRTIMDIAFGFVRSDLATLERELGPSARCSSPAYLTAPDRDSRHEQE